MILINGVKYSCLECIRGHRSTLCQHDKRPLLLVKRKGRPNFLYPGGNKDYRIAVFAQEVAEDTSEESSEKCRDRTVVILKASDKYVFDIKKGEIVGPYSEIDPERDPKFGQTDFFNMKICCLGSLARKTCSCNQKKVLKKRILQSYLRKNQGKVNMDKFMGTHLNIPNPVNSPVSLNGQKSCCSSNKAPDAQNNDSCCKKRVKSEEHEPENKISHVKTELSSNGDSIPTFVDNSSFNDLLFPPKNEPLCNHLADLQALPVQFEASEKSFYSPSQLPMFENKNNPANYSVHTWFLNNLKPHNVNSHDFQNPETSASFSNHAPHFNASIPSEESNAALTDMSPHNMPHFDHHATTFFQPNAATFDSRPPTDNLLVGENNQVFKLINVPSCSVPGSCLCSANCQCPSCETHNTSVKSDNHMSHSSLPFVSEQNNLGSEFGAPINTGHCVDSIAEQSARAPDYYGFLKLVLGIDVDNPSPGQLSGNEENNISNKLDNDSLTESDQCSCAAESCFCSNCERHGIIEGVRLDDLFGPTQ